MGRLHGKMVCPAFSGRSDHDCSLHYIGDCAFIRSDRHGLRNRRSDRHPCPAPQIPHNPLPQSIPQNRRFARIFSYFLPCSAHIRRRLILLQLYTIFLGFSMGLFYFFFSIFHLFTAPNTKMIVYAPKRLPRKKQSFLQKAARIFERLLPVACS